MTTLQVKMMSGEIHKVPFEDSHSIEDVKKSMGKVNSVFEDKADLIKLIFKGKVMDNSQKLKEVEIDHEKDFMVCIVGKPTKPKAEPAPAAAAAPAPAATNTTPAPAAAQPAAAPAPAAQPNAANAAAANVVGNDNAELMVTQISEMGFDRAQVQLALRAAFGNPDRAVEYLMSGNIPDPDQGLPVGEAEDDGGDAQGGEAVGDIPEILQDLGQSPQFEAIRQAIAQNPQALQQILPLIAQQNPQLIQAIQQNPAALQQMLAGGAPGGQGGDAAMAPPPGTTVIQLSQDDQQAVERLQQLGFDRDTVIEAYLACDKNEQMAANFLFDG